MTGTRPWALSARDAARYRDSVLRGVPTHGVPRARPLMARAVALEVAGCASCSLADLDPKLWFQVVEYMSAIEAGRRRFVPASEALVILDDRGSTTYKWADLDEAKPESPEPEASLFDAAGALGPAVRSTDRGTAWAAGRHVRSDRRRLARQLGAVLNVLGKYPDGVHCDPVAAAVGNASNRVSRRISDLRELGYVEDTGRTATAESGRPQTVWRLTPAGWEALRRHQAAEK